MPQLLAIHHAFRRLPSTPSFADAAGLASFLRDPDSYPLFAKPIGGKFSLGVISAGGYDRDADEVVLKGGQRAGVARLALELATRDDGYLFQRRLGPHPAIAEKFGNRLWSVRLVLLITRGRPFLFRAVAKVLTGNHVADNFWRQGNMLAAIDPTTGIITRVVRGTGSEMAVNDPHPDTGRSLIGFQIPCWRQTIGTVLQAGIVLPGVRTQSWDVAITADGPVLLETNFGGDLNLT